jgi:hypothetical protein
MKVTVVEINNSIHDVRESIFVRTSTGQLWSLQTHKHPELYNTLRVGDKIQVTKQTNNPYLIPS